MDDPLEDVARACRAVHAAQDALTDAVTAARASGATWADIGAATHTSRQSAHERWGKALASGCQRKDCPCADHRAGCDCGHGPGRGHGAPHA